MNRRVRCFEIIKTPSLCGDTFVRTERYDLYSDTRSHIEALRVLAKPEQVEYYHRKGQQAWINSADTFKYEFDDATIYIRFLFDHDVATRGKLVKANWRKVDLND